MCPLMNDRFIILDTTYVLPLFGIDIKNLESHKDELEVLWNSGIPNYRLILPSVCIIEVMYKLNREYSKIKNIDTLNRYPTILPTVITSKVVSVFEPYRNINVSQITNKLRHAGHTDLMDCWILATAIGLSASAPSP